MDYQNLEAVRSGLVKVLQINGLLLQGTLFRWAQGDNSGPTPSGGVSRF